MSDQEGVNVSTDRELLVLARSVLADEGYSVEDVDGELPLLLAENNYFVVGVATAPTIYQLLAAEGIAEAMLVDRLTSSDPGPKRWDAYLMLLTQEQSSESAEVSRDLFSINYDTVGLRRIVQTGVAPRLASVRTALAPFVEPIQLDDPSIASDPFESLVEALAARGCGEGSRQQGCYCVPKGGTPCRRSLSRQSERCL